jgi:hypothetical protein
MKSTFKAVIDQLENLDTHSIDVPEWLDDLVNLYEKVKDIEQVLVCVLFVIDFNVSSSLTHYYAFTVYILECPVVMHVRMYAF